MQPFDKWAPLIVVVLLLLSSGKGGGIVPIRPVDPLTGAWVVVVEETSQRTPEITKVVTDAAFWQSVRDRGLNWIIFDKDQPEAAGQVKALSGKLPGLVIQTPGQQSKVLYAGELPKTKEEINALIRRHAGL